MGASARLSGQSVTVAAGEREDCEIRVRDTGMVVDSYVLDVVGDASHWTAVHPGVLNVYPGEEASARLTFAPPRSPTVRAGDVPFAVRVTSREDPESSTVEEGVVVVGAFTEITTDLVPRTSRGRRRARHDLAVDNRGNTRLSLDIAGADPDRKLRVTSRPVHITAEPGTTTFVKIRVRPVRRFWRGPNQNLPFEVFTSGEGVKSASSHASMVQEQLLPRWLIPAISLVIAGVAALVGLWFGILKPTVKSTATDEAARRTQAVSQAAQAAQQTAQQAKSTSHAALAAAGGKKGAAGGGSPATTPIGGRIQLSVDPGKTQGQTLAGIPKKKSFQLTDVVLENPNGDLGTVSIGRGDAVLFAFNLADFRDLDYHFVSPIVIPAGTALTFNSTCANATTQACTPAVYLGGYLR